MAGTSDYNDKGAQVKTVEKKQVERQASTEYAENSFRGNPRRSPLVYPLFALDDLAVHLHGRSRYSDIVDRSE